MRLKLLISKSGSRDLALISLISFGCAAGVDVPEPKKRRKAKRKADSRILQNEGADSNISAFLSALRRGDQLDDFSEFIALLRSMSPVAVDQEVQSMQAS